VGAAIWDTHCHVDLFADRNSIRRECEAASVGVFAVTTTPRAFLKNIELFGGSDHFRVGLGIHPELAATREADLGLFESLLPSAAFVGEIGLDGRPHNRRSLDVQTELLRAVLALCNLRPTVLSLHSAFAVSPLLDLLEQHAVTDAALKILHWFSGSPREAKRASDLGCYFSVNEAMLRNERGNRLVRILPHERVLIETDGPFQQQGEQQLRPTDVGRCLPLLVEVWTVTMHVAHQRISHNMKHVLNHGL